ncbi:MAG: right-handed parallel beta-helix repeat-containing protein [Candidatus Hatepunaea meridiana]|nr:right-handed parallel beta-helix repeat-containing protein [Candidatus Hatepunaea meridiana]
MLDNNYFFSNCYGVKVGYFDQLFGGGGFETLIYNNTFHIGEGAMNFFFGIEILQHNANEPALDNMTILNNHFEGLFIGITVNPEPEEDCYFPYNNFNAVGTPGVHCDGQLGEEDPDYWYPYEPHFYDDQNEEECERLKWDSPLINLGWNGDGDEYMDVTLISEEEEVWYTNSNNVGCTGGPFGGILNHTTYNVADNENIYNLNIVGHPEYDDDFAHFPPDLFEMNEVTVSGGANLLMRPYTAIYIPEDGHFTVKGSINADGKADEGAGSVKRILFDVLEGGDYYYSLHLDDPDADCSFEYCEIKHPKWGFKINGDNQQRVITVENCLIDEGRSGNIRIQGEIEVNCTDTEISNCGYNGVRIYFNRNLSTFRLCQIHDNGDASSECGVFVDDSQTYFYQNTVTDNWCYGFRLWWDSNVSIGVIQNGEEANRIVNNGQQGQQSPTSTGAEIRLENDSYPLIACNDVWDVRGDAPSEREGVIISKHSSNNFDPLNAGYVNYWGDNQGDGDATIVNQEDFYWGNGGAIAVDPHSDGAYTDDMNDFELGMRYRENEQYEQAVNCFRRFIRGNPNSNLARQAVMWIYNSFMDMEGDIDALRREFRQIDETYDERYPRLSWAAKKYSYKCTINSGHHEDAIEEIRNLLDAAPNEAARLALEMDILLLQDRLDDMINSVNNIDKELLRLEEMMDKADDGSRQASPEIPSDFGITAAFPNPFNASTTITYQLPEEGPVTIKVFNLNGREVATLAEGSVVAGYHRFNWIGKDVSSGVYFVQMEWNGNLDRIKLVLVR